MLINNANLTLNQSKFIENTAGSGGALGLICAKCNFYIYFIPLI